MLGPLPPYIVLHLKRFHADVATGTTRKLRTPVRIDKVISLSAHLEAVSTGAEADAGKRQAAATESTRTVGDHDEGALSIDADSDAKSAVLNEEGAEPGTYRLRALVSHHGDNCWAGHYTCVARVGNSLEDNRWVSYDDRTVSLLPEDPTLSPAVQRGGYLLLYERDVPEQRAAAEAALARAEVQAVD